MRRDPRTDAPDLFSFARDYLHTYMPRVRGLSPKTIQAYRISLECFLDFLAENEHVRRDHVTFDHFDRPHLKAWLTWMTEQRHYAPKTVTLRLRAVKAFLAYASAEDITRRALPGIEGAQGPENPEGTDRVPRRTRNPGAARRVHRADQQVPQKPDAADPAV
jgi:site-specific recombinase XerC